MRILRGLAVTALVAVVVALGSSGGRAQGPVVQFYGIGDLTGGGTNSIVQEATQVGSTIYAVGASTKTATNVPIPTLDTAVVWDSATNTLNPIPDLVTFSTPPTNAVSVAYALSANVQSVAGRVRSNNANFNFTLGITVPRTSLTTPRTIEAFTAVDISDNGNIMFGQQSVDNEPPNLSVNNSRAVRVDVSGPSNTRTQVPRLVTNNATVGCFVAGTTPAAPPRTCSDSIPAFRGMSADGSVLVGSAYSSTFVGGPAGATTTYLTTNGLAYRWVLNEPTVTEIPRPAGGTWSSAIAISPNGNLTLAGGNGTNYPFGEVWLYDATALPPTNPITELGSPNSQLAPRLYGGMTADGSVVGVTFGGGGPSQNPTLSNNPVQYAYLHNSFGWFHLANVLTAQGKDLWADGWDPANMILTGIRTVDTDNNGTADVDLVFGQGRRRNANGSAGAPEGFVASFPVGVLAAYQLPAPAPVANRSLVGAWALGSDPNNPLSVMVFLADGTYYTIMSRTRAVAAGYGFGVGNFERGVYTLTAGNAVTFTTTEDRDGAGPHQSGSTPATFVFNGLVSSLNGRQSLSANFTSSDTFVIEDATCSSVCSVFQGTRIAGGAGSIVGGWVVNNPPFFNGKFLIVFLGSNTGYKYFEIADGDPEANNDGDDGTYAFTPPSQLVLSPQVGSPDSASATLTRDELGLFIDDTTDFTLQRIVNPATVLPSITNATLAAGGAEDAAFSYTVTGVNTLTFAASGLPTGLSIDPNTGVISGTPAVNGAFNVGITVTNTFGSTASATLVLAFAPPAPGFHGIGDLAGGSAGSVARDATRVNGTLYAVGSSAVNATAVLPAVPNLDTPALWTSTGGGSLQALPNGAAFVSTQTASIFSYQITPDATYLASQAHSSDTTGTNWVRVERSLLPAIGANLNLSNAPGFPAFANLAMSDNGTVSYGLRQVNAGLPTETRIPVRYEIGLGVNLPDLTATGKTWGFPIPRGTSSDGRIMVGAAANGQVTFGSINNFIVTNARAFRYVHNTGTLTGTTTLIPTLPDGGVWNMPVALSATGAQTVVIGNSNNYPGGEVYLTDAANTITSSFGSPNTALTPRPLGGMTSDGAVVAVTFVGGAAPGSNQVAGLGIPQSNRYAYLHNSHGWFHLGSALLAQGVDLVAMGWDPNNTAVLGIRTVEGVDLVYGQGRRRTVGATNYVDGAVEGFVAEFPAGLLASFNPTPAPPTDQSIVGAWAIGPDPNNPFGVIAFLADGSFVTIGTTAFERGVYTWAGTAGGGGLILTTRFDTNGTLGFSGFNGRSGMVLNLNAGTITDTNCATCPVTTVTRIVTSPGSIVGAWFTGTPGQGQVPGEFALAAFLGSNTGYKYFYAQGFEGDAGNESGTYSWDAGTHLLTVTPTGEPSNSQDATLTRDDLGLVIDEGGDPFTLTRVVAPSSVVPAITNLVLSASGAEDSVFSYTVTANYALTFAANGLPLGLTIDPNTGVISGSPAVNGTFNVAVTVTNTFGATDTKTLVLTFSPPSGSFHGIGDLPTGAVGSGVRDATRINGTIYAVGASTANNIVFCTSLNPNLPAGCLPTGSTVPNLDTPALWSSTGGANGTIQALPLFTGVTNTQTNPRSAFAITQDGAFIASQLQRSAVATGFDWVRVTRSLIPSSSANVNLSFLPSAPGTDNVAISANGLVNYGLGFASITSGNRVPVRYEFGLSVASPFGNVGFSLPDLTPTGKNSGFPIPHGTSADGLVMVGAAANGGVAVTNTNGVLGTNAVAFRYVHNAGTLTGTTTLIPTLPSGSWNMPVALSSTGDQTVVIGNSPEHPRGEVYLTNAVNAITARLGSPNRAWLPRPLGGMTADGSVIAVTFSGAGGFGSGPISALGIPAGNRYAYIHNSHGWFTLSSVLLANGINVEAQGFDAVNFAVTGIRTVEGVDLVYGQGLRHTVGVSGYVDVGLEGFVVELPAGAMAAFNPTPTVPVDVSIVGAWAVGPDPNNPSGVHVYQADGTYIGINSAGFERGLYTWAGNAAGGAFTITTLNDTNGANGQSFNSGRPGLVVNVSGDNYTITDTNCATCTATLGTRVTISPGSIVGGWAYHPPALPPGDFGQVVFLNSAFGYKYFFAQDVEGEWGSEAGTYTWDSINHALVVTPAGDSPTNLTATLTHDSLGLVLVDNFGPAPFVRVVDPATVVPAFTDLTALDATIGVPFAHTIGTTWAETVSADNLPPGLVIDSATGEITGTPTATGVFSAALTATNSFGSSTPATLSVTVTLGTQGTLVVVAPATALYGSSFTASTTGGSGTGGITFAATGGCTNVAGGALITMTSGSLTCSITATKAADGNYAQTTSAVFGVTALPAAQSALTVTGAPVSAGLGSSFTLATSGGSGTGAVTFDATGICSNTSGGALITMTSASGDCMVTATRAADGNYASTTSPAITIHGNSFGAGELPQLFSILHSATDHDLNTTLLAGPLLVSPFTLSNGDTDVSTSTSGNFGAIQAGTSAAVHSTAAFPPRPFPAAGAKWVDYFQIAGGTPGTVVQFLVTTKVAAALSFSAGTANPFPASPGDAQVSTTLRGLPGGQEVCPAGGGFTLCNTIGTRTLEGTYNLAGQLSLTDTTIGTLDDAFLVSLVVGQTYRVEHGVNAYSLIQGMQTMTATSNAIAHFYLDPVTPGAGYVSASGTVYSSPGTVAQNPLVITGAPSVASTAATFTVGSTGGSGTGSVSFTASGVCTRDLGTGTIHMTGQPGTCSIVAVKAGDATYAPAVAPTVDVTVTNAQAPLVVVAPVSAVYGTSFTASTTGGSGTGAVTFAASGGCSNVDDGDLITMTSGTNACSLTATKAGDGSYPPITSDPWTVTAIKAEQAAVLLLGAPASAVFGTSFSVSASGGSGPGAVTFAAAGACSNTAGGALIMMTSGTGTCSLSAAKAGDADYNPSTSAGVAVTAVKASQAALSVTNAPASAVFGTSFTVGSTGGTGTGGVTFAASAACANVSGGALISMVGGSGVCTITATRAGDSNYNPVTSASASVTAVIATSSTSLGVSPSTSAPGQPVTFTATVTSQFGGATSGTVAFKRGNTALGTASVVNGVATLILSNLGNGSHVVTAIYAGDSNSSGSTSSSVTVTVVPPAAPTTTTLATSQTPAIVGQSVTLTATVSSGTPGTITGTVTFKRAQTVLATVSLANGQAAFTTSTLPLGTSNITATYSGDAQYITSTSAGLNQVITQASTTTSLGLSPNPSNGNQLVTLTATITSGTPGAITGTVTFKRGQTVLGTVAVSGNQASMTTATLPAGSSTLTATYSGDATYVGSTSPAITHTVNTGSTTTTLTSSLNPSTFGTAVTFTATVVSTLGTVPTGSVEFSEGSTVYGTAVVDAAGHATFTTSTLTLKNGKTATHNIKAKYLGNAYNTTSTSLVLAQVVNP